MQHDPQRIASAARRRDGGGPWARIARARISRRRALASGAAAAGGVAALLALGCDDDGGEEQPQPGGTLRFTTSLPMSYGLDPQIEQGAGLAIFPKVYGYLWSIDPGADEMTLDHAESVEQPDEATWVIRMRGGPRFHDRAPAGGRAVTAYDVVRTIERYRDNPLVVTKTWHENVLEAIGTYDGHSVIVRTKRPYAWSPYYLGDVAAGAILPREVTEERIDLQGGGAGSGPFAIERAAADSVRIARHAAYHGEQPYVDAMEWSIVADGAAREAAFRDGAADIAANRDRAEARAFASLHDSARVEATPGLASLAIALRVDRPPFADARVREALDAAIDRQSLVHDITASEGSIAGPVSAHLASGYWSLAPDAILEAQGGPAIEMRRAHARALLEAASPGLAFTLQVPDVPELLDVAAAVRAQLASIDVNARLLAQPQLVAFVNQRRGEFEAALVNHPPYESPDLPLRWYHSAGVDGTGSALGFADAGIDGLVERAWGEPDRTARRDIVLDAQRAMVAARPMLPLFSGIGYAAVRGHVQGTRPGLTGSSGARYTGQWLTRAARRRG